jgi:predicted esterase
VSPLRAAVAAVLLAAASAAGAAEGVSDAGSKIRQGMASDLAAFAGECAKLGAKAEGLAAVEEARDLDRLCPGIKAAEEAVAALPADAPDAAAFPKRRAEAGKSLAKSYDRLAALKHDAKDDARFDDYAARALRWDSSEARIKRAASVAEAAQKDKRIVGAGLLLRGVLRADPEGAARGKYDGLAERMAREELLVLGSADRDLVAFVSLPREWKKGKPCPVLVAVDGAGCGFEGAARTFATTRGSRPFIVVSPMTLSNTNELVAAKYPAYTKAVLDRWNGKRIDFDGAGMEGVLAAVRRMFGGEEKVFVTGFSGGGNYCYYKLLHDPAGVRGAAPCCANFSGYGVDGAPGAGPSGGPPVHIFTGEKDEHRDFTFGKKDSPGIEPQTDNAVAALQKLGFTRVERTMVKGVGHSAQPDQVWRFVDGVLGAK